MKAITFLLFKLLKFAKFSKVLLPAASIFISIGSYAMLYGWKYAFGFVGLIFFHEMGHYIAARKMKLDVGLPTFIPFVGAWIELKEQPINAEVEAYVAYAGPFIGTLASFAFYYYGRSINSGLMLALAQAGFIINLFNLIPLHPLDGGRITSIISPRIWFLGVPILICIWLYQPSPMLIVIAILAFPQLIKAWNYDANAPENQLYYMIANAIRFEYAVLYLVLAIVLALMIGIK
jgi:Zn-dependent protease